MRFLYKVNARPRRVTDFLTKEIQDKVYKESRNNNSYNILIDMAVENGIDIWSGLAKSIFNFRIPTNSTKLFRFGKQSQVIYTIWDKMWILQEAELTEWYSDMTSYLIVTNQLWKILKEWKEDIQSFLNMYIKSNELPKLRRKQQPNFSTSWETSS